MFLAIIYFITGCSMGNDAVTGTGSATSGDTISPSARKRIIQSVGRTCCDWYEKTTGCRGQMEEENE